MLGNLFPQQLKRLWLRLWLIKQLLKEEIQGDSICFPVPPYLNSSSASLSGDLSYYIISI